MHLGRRFLGEQAGRGRTLRLVERLLRRLHRAREQDRIVDDGHNVAFDEVRQRHLDLPTFDRARRGAESRGWCRGSAMAGSSPVTDREAIADHFRSRMPALLDAWRAAVVADSRLTSGDALPRGQLEDHLPLWLESFVAVLAAATGPQQQSASAAEEKNAESHGLQRWQQGYDLHEVTREWGCMHRVLVAELERYASSHGDAAALAEARIKLAEQVSEATSESAEEYFRLHRVEAQGNVRDLERALGDLRDLENARAELWQQAAHDLRGNLGVVSNVTEGLGFQALPADKRQSFLGLLRNNVAALRHLLDDVTSLARIQAGQEQRVIANFDAPALLERLCNDFRPLAEEKGLYLEASGVPALIVDGDAVKVRRVAQNLLLNALNYTKQGGVSVSWGEAAGVDERWMVTIEDTGPGFHAGPGAPLASALARATSEAGQGHVDAPQPVDPRPVQQAQGEGLGLTIVKRLCELMNATIELESVPGRGTTFRILLPRRFATAPN